MTTDEEASMWGSDATLWVWSSSHVFIACGLDCYMTNVWISGFSSSNGKRPITSCRPRADLTKPLRFAHGDRALAIVQPCWVGGGFQRLSWWTNVVVIR